jgi:hypothetical protein
VPDRDASNDQPWSSNDGGFIYASSGASKRDEYTKQRTARTGSMTYAGVKSYIYANVSKSDPTVQSAWSGCARTTTSTRTRGWLGRAVLLLPHNVKDAGGMGR